jgi:hypothetical protein
MDGHEASEGLWFGDDSEPTSTHAGRRRTAWIALACIACVGALAVPVAFALSSSGGPSTSSQATKNTDHGRLGDAAAKRAVLSALSATTSSGSFDVTYEFDPTTAPTVATTTTTQPCNVVQTPSALQGSDLPGSSGEMMICPGTGSSSSSLTTPITGQATIDTDPFGMVATSNVSGLGVITLRDDGTDVWEIGGADYGLSPGSTDQGPGSPLSGFASLVEGTLGQRQGALAMGGLASPTGYLDLEQSMVSGANEIGTGTVDGVPVTTYQVSIQPDATIPGLNAEQSKTVADADAVLKSQGYTGSTILVSIDASGFIRQTRSTAHFTDGSTGGSVDTFSDFGCAGTVLMPGQTGATAPPAGCVSPDTGVAPTTTTTTSSAPATTSTTPTTSTSDSTTPTSDSTTPTSTSTSTSQTVPAASPTSSTTTTTSSSASSGTTPTG